MGEAALTNSSTHDCTSPGGERRGLAGDLKPGKHSVTIRSTNKQPKRIALHVIHVQLY